MSTEALTHSLSAAERYSAAQHSLRVLLKQQGQIIYALMLHDIKARYFGNGIGCIITIIWPMTHLILIVSIHYFGGRVNPFGTSIVLFTATGVVPYITVAYISRFIVFGGVQNRSFLQYPIIKIFDIFVARALLELLIMFLIVMIFYIGMSIAGIDCAPYDVNQACAAFLASMLFGLGLGVFDGVISLMIPLWPLAHNLIKIAMYFTCGVIILPTGLPYQVQYAMSFNPLFQAVLWMRTAYFADYSKAFLDKTYLLEFGLITLFLGILMERNLRGLMLSK